MKTPHKKTTHGKTVMEKPFLESKKESDGSAKPSHEHTIFGVHEHHQAHVNRLKHTDPDLWNRIRSWN